LFYSSSLYYNKLAIFSGVFSPKPLGTQQGFPEVPISLLPTEVVTMNITSLDFNDVEVMVYQHGKEKRHIVKGANSLGLFLAFQNR
jgi:hypothetical protein